MRCVYHLATTTGHVLHGSICYALPSAAKVFRERKHPQQKLPSWPRVAGLFRAATQPMPPVSRRETRRLVETFAHQTSQKQPGQEQLCRRRGCRIERWIPGKTKSKQQTTQGAGVAILS